MAGLTAATVAGVGVARHHDGLLDRDHLAVAHRPLFLGRHALDNRPHAGPFLLVHGADVDNDFLLDRHAVADQSLADAFLGRVGANRHFDLALDRHAVANQPLALALDLVPSADRDD